MSGCVSGLDMAEKQKTKLKKLLAGLCLVAIFLFFVRFTFIACEELFRLWSISIESVAFVFFPAFLFVWLVMMFPLYLVARKIGQYLDGV